MPQKRKTKHTRRKKPGPLPSPMGPPPEAEPVFDLLHLKRLIIAPPRRKRRR